MRLGENFRARKIVYFSSCSNFAAEVVVEKIAFQSEVDSEHCRVWSVTVIISIGDSEVNVITRLVCARREHCARSSSHSLRQNNAEDSCRLQLYVYACCMGRKYAMYGRPASGLEVRVRVHDVNSLLCLFEDSAKTIRFSFNFLPRGGLGFDNSEVSVVSGCVILTRKFNAHQL